MQTDLQTPPPGYRPYRWLMNKELVRNLRARYVQLTPLEQELLERLEHAVRADGNIANAVGVVS